MSIRTPDDSNPECDYTPNIGMTSVYHVTNFTIPRGRDDEIHHHQLGTTTSSAGDLRRPGIAERARRSRPFPAEPFRPDDGSCPSPSERTSRLAIIEPAKLHPAPDPYERYVTSKPYNPFDHRRCDEHGHALPPDWLGDVSRSDVSQSITAGGQPAYDCPYSGTSRLAPMKPNIINHRSDTHERHLRQTPYNPFDDRRLDHDGMHLPPYLLADASRRSDVRHSHATVHSAAPSNAYGRKARLDPMKPKTGDIRSSQQERYNVQTRYNPFDADDSEQLSKADVPPSDIPRSDSPHSQRVLAGRPRRFALMRHLSEYL